MPDGDLERRLGEVLRDRAGGFTPSGDLPARIGARTRQRAHNRRVAASMAAVAVLLGIAAPLALRGGDDDQETAALVADSAPAETVAAAAADAQVTDSAGATSRAAEDGRSDTTAGGADDADIAVASDTTAESADEAPEPSAAPPAPAPTSTVAGAVSAEDGASAPPYLLAVMPGDDRVALVSTETSQVIRYVEAVDPAGDVFYDDAGEVVFRAGGCGTSAQGVAVAGDDVVVTDAAWQDAVAITSWGTGPSQRVAWVTDNSCNRGSGFTLTVRTSDGDRSLSIADLGFLAFSPDGASLAWPEQGGLALLDVTDPNSEPISLLLATPDPICEVSDLAFGGESTTLYTALRCPGNVTFVSSYDVAAPDASPVQGSHVSLPPLWEVAGLDVDVSGQWLTLRGTGYDGDFVYVATADGSVVTTIPGARSAHWTTATG